MNSFQKIKFNHTNKNWETKKVSFDWVVQVITANAVILTQYALISPASFHTLLSDNAWVQ